MKASRIAVAGAATLALVAGGTVAGAAVAGPVDGSGVIHGCYSNQASHGSHVVKLQNAGTKCPQGTTAVSWNKKGPAGPQGQPGAAGNTVLSGIGAPASSLGSVGDFYIDTAASVLFGPKTASGWPATGISLVGPAGPPGPSGPTCSAPGPGANLTECSLSSLTGDDLTGANMTSANLANADLTNATLTGAAFTFANLSGANLTGTDLNAVNFTGANLTGATIRGADINAIIWGDTTCPDGTNSDFDGGTCEGHGV